MTWKEYEQGREDRLRDLRDRVHRGTYRAQPSRRVYIRKEDGRQRPLGVAALEDKIVQQAVTRILNQIYEEDFLGFSYGFRPERSQHQALDALTVGIERKKVNWILDLDIRGFFDNLNHEQLVQYVEERIADPRILSLIRKWLKAGVCEEGQWKETEVGTPQGSGTTPRTQKITCCRGVRFRLFGQCAGIDSAASCRRDRETVADGYCIVTHHNLLGQQTYDFLPFRYVHCLSVGSKPLAKLSQTVHQSQVPLFICGGGLQGLQFALYGALLFS